MADVDEISTTERVDDVIDKLAEAIVYWNSTKYYKDHGGNKETDGNCQDFVEYVLEKIGMKLNVKPESPLGKFLTKLRTKGTCEMHFPLDDVFKRKFDLDKFSFYIPSYLKDEVTSVQSSIHPNHIHFKTHYELDEFVNYLLKVDPLFETGYKEEANFLKSFDRGFWLRFYKFPKDNRWKPLQQLDEVAAKDGDVYYRLDCPFKDPEETQSIRFLDGKH